MFAATTAETAAETEAGTTLTGPSRGGAKPASLAAAAAEAAELAWARSSRCAAAVDTAEVMAGREGGTTRADPEGTEGRTCGAVTPDGGEVA